ncbi:MAG: succinylglutamate-semialdehyde dehydrogenase [Sphingobium sp.]
MTTLLQSLCPATGALVWEGPSAQQKDVLAAVDRARLAFTTWSETTLVMRIDYIERYRQALSANADDLAAAIGKETGKPLWEAKQEVASMVGKIPLSIQALSERAGTIERETAFGRSVLRHRPHGVMAVFGPYNFPGHLPNGHIVPALLAGNTIVFKPSEEAPLVGESIAGLMAQAGLPDGVFNLVQGGRDTGIALADAPIDGLLFTGSAAIGAHLRRQFADRPERILALELGGNNPLIAWDGPADAVASIIAASAFISAGQRCSCARRLIIPDGSVGDEMLAQVAALTQRLTLGAWDEEPEPSMGPLISERAADRVRNAYAELVDQGARIILPLDTPEDRSRAFLTPAILDVTGLAVPDAEIFGPVLQVIRVPDFDAAIAVANNTAFGLSGGLISQDTSLWERYALRSRAGVCNWNRPTTGAAGSMPFGGLGASGNHRPSAYYAADYCAYPMASFEASGIKDQSGDIRGLRPRPEDQPS